MKAAIKHLILFPLVAFLVACGGGGSLGTTDGGPSNPTAVTYSIAVEIVDADSGVAATELSASTPLTVNATVTSSDGSSTQGKVVSFSFDQDGLATFSVENGRAVVNSEGVATIGLFVDIVSGAGEIIATLDADTTAQIAFNSAGDGDQTTLIPASLVLSASSLQLASSGSDEIELIALVKNEQQVLMQGVEVRFSVEGDAALLDGNVVAGADGKARTILTTGENPQNRTILITAVTGSSNPITQTIAIQVIGTQVSINGPTSVILNATAEYVVLLADSDGRPIPNEQLTLTTETGVLSNTSPTTNSSGLVMVDYTSMVSGTDVIVASGLNAASAFNIAVQQDDFAFSSVPISEIPLNQEVTLTVTWEKDGAAYANGSISFVAPRGEISSADTVTNAQGQASFTISSTNAGFSAISATGVDGDDNIVSARANIEFIATEADNIIVDGNPDSIGPDGQGTTITAVVRDINGNLVKGKIIEFKVTDVSGGSLSPSTGVTNSSGIASTVFTSVGTTQIDGVEIIATVQDKPSVTGKTYLTVSDRAFDLSFGTGSTIQIPEDKPSSYIKEFAVYVSDSDGNAVNNVNLTVSLSPEKFVDDGEFRKGYWQWNPTIEIWEAIVTAHCVTEDQNDNGLRDGEGTPMDEDINQDGDLTPGIVGVIRFKNGSSSTDISGSATLEWEYPKEFAVWTDMVITVLGSSTGSESQETQKYTLPIAAIDINTQAIPPPANPYGSGPNCTDTD
ncbi:Ig-like domain-containing protein [Alteromonadaceae bacterium BrNp21-10]|nr:Ig-like domain-containing protein [Alteromonadaceae bacterium BrNp21-10]